MRTIALIAVVALVGCAHAPVQVAQCPDYEGWHAPMLLDKESLDEPQPEVDEPWLAYRGRPLEGSGGAIHTWTTGDRLNAADLNANFQHIHNLMVGGHGARLVDGDITASAAISSSKLAAYRLIPRAWVVMDNVCVAPATCTITASVNIASVTSGTTGNYTVTLDYTATNGSYAVMCTDADTNAVSVLAVDASSRTSFDVVSHKPDDGTAEATSFSCVVFDND